VDRADQGVLAALLAPREVGIPWPEVEVNRAVLAAQDPAVGDSAAVEAVEAETCSKSWIDRPNYRWPN
jgi:hypothetical protein